MDCLIDNTIKDYAEKGKTSEAIRSYISRNYGINMDLISIRKRLKRLKLAIQVRQI